MHVWFSGLGEQEGSFEKVDYHKDAVQLDVFILDSSSSCNILEIDISTVLL